MHTGRGGGHAARAVIVGLDCVTGLQSARILAARGVPVIGVAADKSHFCARTRVVERVIQAPTAEPALVDALCALGPSLGEKAVLFPCTDASVLTIARHRDRLAPWYHVALPPTGLLTALMDKVEFIGVAAEAGVPAPATHILRERADAERAARELPFPAVLKPALKTPRWEANSPRKVHRVASGDELLRLYDTYAPLASVLVAQQWIDGGDDTLYSCNCYYDRDARPVCSFVARKIRQWPPGTGTSSLGEEVRNDTVRDLTLRLFDHVGFRGLGYLEVKRHPRTGEHFVIEANPGRPTGRSAIAEAGGVELLYTMYCETLQLPLPAGLEQRYGGAKWIYWRQDIRSAFHYYRRGELSLREWAASWRGRKASAVFSWSDPWPALADIPALVRESLARLGAARRRHVATVEAEDPAPPPERAPVPAAPTVHISPARHEVAEYDLHGVLGVRLLDAGPAEMRAVEQQIGAMRGRLARDPDVTVRFVERLPTEGMRYVEVNRSGYTEQGFLIRANGTAPAWALVPFDTLGAPSEFICERGARTVPLLKAALRLAALQRGFVPFHASAFEWEGRGVIVTGWTHGGKTSALLAFSEHGARYVGDELVLIPAVGGTMFGMPAALRISDAQFRQLRHVRDRRSLSRRLVMRALRETQRLTAPAAPVAPSLRRPLGYVHAAAREAEARARTPLPLDRLFPEGQPLAADPRTLFLMTSHASDEITVTPMSSEEIAARMAHSLRAESLGLMGHYLAFRFAFPDRRNPAIESMHLLERRLLTQALQGMRAFVVRHPYPAPLRPLFEAMHPFCGPPPLQPLQPGVRLEASLR